jgi:hypothetical protein
VATWTSPLANGGPHPLLAQNEDWSCVLASIAMVVNRHGGGKPTARAVAQITQTDVQNNEALVRPGGYVPAVQDRYSMKPSLLRMVGVGGPPTQPTPPGTASVVNLVPTLAAYKITANVSAVPLNRAQLKAALDGASLQHPVILRIEGHVFLSDGPAGGGTYIVCDPDPVHGMQTAVLAAAPAVALNYNGITRVIERLWTT